MDVSLRDFNLKCNLTNYKVKNEMLLWKVDAMNIRKYD
jgi:hypothetical protein